MKMTRNQHYQAKLNKLNDIINDQNYYISKLENSIRVLDKRIDLMKAIEHSPDKFKTDISEAIKEADENESWG